MTSQNQYDMFVQQISGRSNRSSRRNIPLAIRQRNHTAIVMIPCVCGQLFMTRSAKNIHMATECHVFREYII